LGREEAEPLGFPNVLATFVLMTIEYTQHGFVLGILGQNLSYHLLRIMS